MKFMMHKTKKHHMIIFYDLTQCLMSTISPLRTGPVTGRRFTE